MKKKQWLQDIKLHNAFSALPEEAATDPTESPTNRIPKPPPIYIDAKIIDPLIELLNNTAGKDNYVIKQIKIDQAKVQTNTPEIFRKVTRSLKEKNASYHTFQLKTDKSYKAVIRGLHPKTNTGKISEELEKIGHQVRTINNINKYDTKQPLPLFLVELEPRNNNKEIYDIEKLLNTIVKVEPPRHKKEIPQCIMCQQYGHTKNYCNRTPACVKCAKNHLTIHCPSTGKIEEVKCYNCNTPETENTQPVIKVAKLGNNYNANCSRPYEAGQSLTHKPNRTARNPKLYQIQSKQQTPNPSAPTPLVV